jgi:hypothetical protein
VRSTRGSTAIETLLALGIAAAGLIGMDRLGAAFRDDIAGPSSPAPFNVAPPAKVVAGQAAVATGLLRAARYADATVSEMRRFASSIPEGETRVLHLGGEAHTFHYLPSREQLVEFVHTHRPLSSNSETTLHQLENWAHLVDRAFDESLARGIVPGAGGSRTRKGIEGALDFSAADAPAGVFVLNAHGSRTGISIGKTLRLTGTDGAQVNRMLPGARPLSDEAIAADLVAHGHRAEPLVLDICSTGSQACRPDTVARKLANRLGVPVIAPTRPVWVTRPRAPERPYRARLAGNALDAAGYPIAAGDWVLVLPDSWGGHVFRGPHALPE